MPFPPVQLGKLGMGHKKSGVHISTLKAAALVSHSLLEKLHAMHPLFCRKRQWEKLGNPLELEDIGAAHMACSATHINVLNCGLSYKAETKVR